MVRRALDRREFGLRWQREGGHLPPDARRDIRHRLRAIAADLAARIDAEAPELRAWAVLSLLTSPSHHHSRLDRARYERLLRAAAHALITTDLPAARQPRASAEPGSSQRQPEFQRQPESRRQPRSGPDESGPRGPVSRREALLAASIRLFAERGYRSVGLADIGAAADIAGPSV